MMRKRNLTIHCTTIVMMLITIMGIRLSSFNLTSAQGQTGLSSVCQNGFANEYPCHNVDFLAYLSLNSLGGTSSERAANLWGWTDPETGKEYVLMGLTDRLTFVDISQPLSPTVVGYLPNHTATKPDKYRDVKVYRDHAFIIADSPSLHGMQVFDLTQLRQVITQPTVFTTTAHFDGFGDAHNIYINEATGYAYVARTTRPDRCSGAVYMVNVQDPSNPVSAGCYPVGDLASDTMCVVYQGPDMAYQGREICLVASDDNLLVADMTVKTQPLTLSDDLDYVDIARAHLAWFTADHRYFLSADMNDELQSGLNTRIFVWDAQDLKTIKLMGIYEGPTGASDHNIWVKDQHAYIGNFHAGIRILNIQQIAQTTFTQTAITQAAFFDLIPETNGPGHIGVWAIYPYFASDVLAVSAVAGSGQAQDFQAAGLYLLKKNLTTVRIYLPLILK